MMVAKIFRNERRKVMCYRYWNRNGSTL